MTHRPRSLPARARRLLPATFVALAALALLVPVGPAPAGTALATVDEPKDVGEIRLVDPNSGDQLAEGSSDTFWQVALPVDATCPGDSEHDQWRTQSFIIPADEDPVGLLYGPIGPEPWDNGIRYSLFKADTEPYVHELLLPNDRAGLPGRIAALPVMSFSVIAGEEYPSGTYRMGIACSYFNQTAKYWDAQIEITADLAEPTTFTWRLLGAAGAGASDGGNSSFRLLLVLGAGVAVVAAAFFVIQKRITPRAKVTTR